MIAVVDTTHCVRYRLPQATCSACASACPVGALDVGRGVTVNAHRCVGCDLCAPACPNEAIGVTATGRPDPLPRVTGRAPVSIGCHRHLSGSRSTRVACLGGLDARDLAVLAVLADGEVELDVSLCSGCAAGPPVLAAISEQLVELATTGHPVRDRIRLRANSDDDLGTTGLARRGLLGRLLRPWTDGPGTENGIPRTSRRELRRTAASLLGAGARDRILVDWLLSGTEWVPRKLPGCDDCGRCAAFCAPGALRRARVDGQRVLAIDASACTGCQACVDFCTRQAIAVPPARTDRLPPGTLRVAHEDPDTLPYALKAAEAPCAEDRRAPQAQLR